jgi:hypothetical protein
MCGAGNFLKIWKESDSNACPKLFEDSTFVWRCQAQSNQAVWTDGLWLNPLTPLTRPPEDIQPLFHAQEDIGWGIFLEEFHHKDWQLYPGTILSAHQIPMFRGDVNFRAHPGTLENSMGLIE